MEPLQLPNPRNASNSPRRHIHSSFPYYFYSTPYTPNSYGISAFVSNCESRLREAQTTTMSESITFDCPPVALADAGDLFCYGKLVPSEPLTASPLKLPPRLHYIKNLRKSLRSIQSFNLRQPPGKDLTSDVNSSKEFDPFAIAMERAKKEDAPWCQVSGQHHRRAKSYDYSWSEAERDQDWGQFGGKASYNALVKVEGREDKKKKKSTTRLEPVQEKSASSSSSSSSSREHVWEKARRKIGMCIKRLRKSKEKAKYEGGSDEGLIMEGGDHGVKTLARHRQNHQQHLLLACLRLA